MRIGLLTTSYPRHPGDYAGSFVADRVARLLAEGHVVDVLAAAEGTPGADPPPGPHDPGLTVTRIPAGPVRGATLFYGSGAPEALERGGRAGAVAWLAALQFSAGLAAAARARVVGWDTLESHWLIPCALVAGAVAPGARRRAYAHSGDVALLERLPLGSTLARRLARDGTELRFVSERLADRFATLAGERVGTVEPLPPPAALFPARRHGPDPAARARLGLRGPTVLAVGRLVPIKGHDRLIHACARARAEGGRPVEVVVLGDGPERDRLAGLAAELGVPLRLPGFVPRSEVAHWLSAADLYLQPSISLANGRAEGAPLATAEASAVGIPIVVENDPNRLAAAIGRLAAATG